MVRVNHASPLVQLSGFNNTIDTLERGVKERVFFVKNDRGEFVPPPTPESGHFRATLLLVRERFEKMIPRVAPLSYDEFVLTFRGRKRVIYQNAVESLLGSSFSPLDAQVKVFTKYEKTNFTQKSDPVPRVISPRSPRYNVELGRFLRPLEERLYKCIGELFGHPTVIKGMNSATSGRVLWEKWEKFKRPVALGLDASRFDQHVSIPALEWEHSVYELAFPIARDRLRLRRLLSYQLRNRCVGYTGDGRLRYTTEGGRMSGDMNTGCGNCLLTCSMIFAYAQERGVTVQLANNGDDCVVFMESEDLERFQFGLGDWFLAMGFKMAVEEPCYTFEEVEFCQTHPVFVGPNVNDYLMIRHPKWGIAKDTLCVHNYSEPHMFRGWLDAVGVGGLAMTGQVPVFQDFYSTYVRFGAFRRKISTGESWGVRSLEKGMTRKYGEILPITRASFYWAFGVTPDEQLVLEKFYREMDIGTKVSHDLSYQLPMPL